MPDPADTEHRLTALEAGGEDAAAEAMAARQDAVAARHLAAAHNRESADLGEKVDANRRAINALGVQTAARFDRLEAEMRAGFAETGRGLRRDAGAARRGRGRLPARRRAARHPAA